ncbi:MAG TPA: hypothetical protein VIE91_04130 [Methylophilaceae bacterium]|jgi:hypothetical protein
MKRTTLLAALSITFAVNAVAAEPIVTTDSQSLNKVLVVAVTEPGVVASDTAWLLSNQALDGREIPILMVLKPETRVSTLNSLKLTASDLPALIFLDSNGNELGRVVGAAPAVKVFEKNNLKTVSMN